jgi:Kinesin motor domain
MMTLTAAYSPGTLMASLSTGKIVILAMSTDQSFALLHCAACILMKRPTNIATALGCACGTLRRTSNNSSSSNSAATAAKAFEFTGFLAPEATQTQVYDAVGRSIVDGVLSGYTGTIFAYGQTGSGECL